MFGHIERIIEPVMMDKLIGVVVIMGMSFTVCDLLLVLALKHALLLLDLGATLSVLQVLLVHLSLVLGALPIVLKLVDALLCDLGFSLEDGDAFLSIPSLPLELNCTLFSLENLSFSRTGTFMGVLCLMLCLSFGSFGIFGFMLQLVLE